MRREEAVRLARDQELRKTVVANLKNRDEPVFEPEIYERYARANLQQREAIVNELMAVQDAIEDEERYSDPIAKYCR